jgi:hypothetical protein
MACQWPQGVWVNFKERAKRLYPLRYCSSEGHGNSLKEPRPGGLSSKWRAAYVATQLQIAVDMRLRRALAVGDFELSL